MRLFLLLPYTSRLFVAIGVMLTKTHCYISCIHTVYRVECNAIPFEEHPGWKGLSPVYVKSRIEIFQFIGLIYGGNMDSIPIEMNEGFQSNLSSFLGKLNTIKLNIAMLIAR